MVKDIEVINRELQIGGRITLPIEWRREMELRVGSEVI
ncbi:MAG: AbrB/MazE/SpoVT family DNA-binding domain-containing protein, partial [Candidatus Aenigmarchaeota archaeon]|nr:AbrB/MazE/SpoVT family DNA-binding domain-containing protein [Candidatus Aenigmarchaeota archaeon]